MSRCFSRLRIVFVAVGLACAARARAGAQGGSSPFPPRPADPACADYLAAAVALPPTVAEADLGLTLARLHGCIPELGRGIAAAATAVRGTTDTALAVLAFHGGQAYRDTAIFRAARTIATDPAAAEVMRVMSLLVLLSYPGRGRHTTT